MKGFVETAADMLTRVAGTRQSMRISLDGDTVRICAQTLVKDHSAMSVMASRMYSIEWVCCLSEVLFHKDRGLLDDKLLAALRQLDQDARKAEGADA